MLVEFLGDPYHTLEAVAWIVGGISSLTISLDQFMFGYTCTICLFPLALHGFAAGDLKALELGSTKREEDFHIAGKVSIY